MGTLKTTSQTTYFRPTQKLGSKDKTLGDRIVGYYEFGKSLEALTTLIRNSTSEEIQVFNEVIDARPEFRIYTNLARGFENPGSTLRLEPLHPADDFSRSGLFWLTSLARIEFATTRSIFHDAESPFLEVAPENPSEQVIYFWMLMDSFKSHYYDTMDTQQLKFVIAQSRNGPDQKVLAYIRRLALMADMYAAMIPAASENFTEIQLAQLKSMGRKFHKKFKELTHNVGVNLAARNGAAINSVTDSRTQTFYESCTQKCARLAKQVGVF
ncbi:MAG: hypothetical protein VX768_08935 [Planctomycetota bacterium]|nr:hypothetical protein [Planctomycetota bacterium]